MPRMNLYNNFIVAPISRALGAVVTGIDLSKKLEPSQVSEVRDALNEFLVLFFRDQTLTVVDQRTFAEYLGTSFPTPAFRGFRKIQTSSALFENPERTTVGITFIILT